ncbi:hypothetical protein BpHYR1_017642 [Brachionus plicatilis]|uniref:Uncharacterized protein n=1 Tax=Brachionus plicatilis TaxID=10195 RepID=A0A3M7SDR3_BRAPC|nr:hypothetical protein BpHYR1_017642 [Brachionus plicatilis]
MNKDAEKLVPLLMLMKVNSKEWMGEIMSSGSSLKDVMVVNCSKLAPKGLSRNILTQQNVLFLYSYLVSHILQLQEKEEKSVCVCVCVCEV